MRRAGKQIMGQKVERNEDLEQNSEKIKGRVGERGEKNGQTKKIMKKKLNKQIGINEETRRKKHELV